MALFIARFISQAEDGDTSIPPTAPSTYTDRGSATPEARAAIDWLTERGVVTGYSDNTYRPGGNVTRAQMASFIARAMEEVGADLDEGDGGNYPDVDDNATHSDNINKLTEAGVVRGFTDGTYRPGANVTRQQMAQFIILAAAELNEQGLWEGEFEEPVTPPPATNQTYTVTPADEAINTVSGPAGTAGAESGARTYTADVGTASAVSIALIPTGQVLVDEDGVVTFRDADANNRADGFGITNAHISSVQGVSTGNTADGTAGSTVTNVTPSNGTVTFTVNSRTANQSVIPVVWRDANNNQQLDLVAPSPANNLPKEPAEDFGIGGSKLWIPAAAGFGTYNNVTVDLVRTDQDFFTTSGGDAPAGAAQRTFRYDAGDVFQYSSGPANPTITISMANFETYLSVGDVLNVNYNPDGISTFNIVDDRPAAPSNVVATVTDANNNGVANDVRITWDRPANPDVAGYVIERAPVVDGTVGAWATVMAARAGAANTTYNDLNRPAGTYAYRVLAYNTQSGAQSPWSAVAQATVPTAAQAAPVSILSEFVDTKTGATTPANSVLDAGDRLTFTFAGPVSVESNATVVIRDLDGDAARLTNGANATMTTGGLNNSQLIINVTGTPTTVANTGVINTDTYSAIDSVTGIGNEAGLWNLAESGRDDVTSRTRIFWQGGNPATPTTVDNNIALRDSLVDFTVAPNTAGPVVVNPSNNTVRINPGAANINHGETFRVYNRQGVQIASATYDNTNGTTVTTSPGFSAGDTIYVVTYAVAGGQPVPSASLRIDIPGTNPVVNFAAGGTAGTGGVLNVGWLTQNPFTDQVRIVGSAGGFTVWDSTNSVQVAYGTSVSPTGLSEFKQVQLNTNLAAGTYYLRVAPTTVHDEANNPNLQISYLFNTADVAGPSINIATGPTDGDTTSDREPTWTGTAQANQPGATVTNVAARIIADGETAASPGAQYGARGTVTITSGAGTANVAWSFTADDPLPEGDHQIQFRVTDSNGNTATTGLEDFTVSDPRPAMTAASAATRDAGDTEAFSQRLTVTWSEASQQIGPATNFTVQRCTDAIGTFCFGSWVAFATGQTYEGGNNTATWTIELDNATAFTSGTLYRVNVAANTALGNTTGNNNAAHTRQFVAGDTVAPDATVTQAIAGEVIFRVQFDEAINTATLSLGDFICEPASLECVSYSYDSSTRTATVNLNRPLVAGDVVGIGEDTVRDTAGNYGPVADVTETL
jgi:hypothetical protein